MSTTTASEDEDKLSPSARGNNSILLKLYKDYFLVILQEKYNLNRKD